MLVIGAGIIGITAVKWARFFGAEHAVISDLDPARLRRAKLVGATDIIDAGRMETDHLISQSVSLDEVPDAFTGLMRPNDHCKVMIEPR